MNVPSPDAGSNEISRESLVQILEIMHRLAAPEAMPELLREIMEVGKVAGEHECTRVLSDLREATITAPLTDIYEMAKAIEKKQVLKSFRRAIVISKDHQDYAFWETVCYNQGHRMVRIFQSYDQARKWVLSA